jgi:hypothetical protein
MQKFKIAKQDPKTNNKPGNVTATHIIDKD